MGAELMTGERVRLKATSTIQSFWRIPQEAEGIVICGYRILSGNSRSPERVDVPFGACTVLWGKPREEFELIGGSMPPQPNEHRGNMTAS